MKFVCVGLFMFSCYTVFGVHWLSADDLNGTEGVVFEDTTLELANGTLAKGFVRFDGGFSVPAGASVTLSVIPPVKGEINLNATGKVVLSSDLFLASNATLPQGGVLDGQGNVVFLQGNLTIPRGKKLKISGDTIIDGQGHELIFEEESGGVVGGVLSVDGQAGTTLTLRNIIVKGLTNYTGNRAFKFGAAENQALILDNAVVHLSGDYTFIGGQLNIHNESIITGAHTMAYRSSYDCTIEKASTLMLDIGVIFKYYPEDKQKNHVVMQDQTSALFLNGCTINTPHRQGLVLTKGHIIIDHKAYLYGSGTAREWYGVTFGDDTEVNNVLVDVMPGASLEVTEGILTYKNLDSSIPVDDESEHL